MFKETLHKLYFVIHLKCVKYEKQINNPNARHIQLLLSSIFIPLFFLFVLFHYVCSPSVRYIWLPFRLSKLIGFNNAHIYFISIKQTHVLFEIDTGNCHEYVKRRCEYDHPFKARCSDWGWKDMLYIYAHVFSTDWLWLIVSSPVMAIERQNESVKDLTPTCSLDVDP